MGYLPIDEHDPIFNASTDSRDYPKINSKSTDSGTTLTNGSDYKFINSPFAPEETQKVPKRTTKKSDEKYVQSSPSKNETNNSIPGRKITHTRNNPPNQQPVSPASSQYNIDKLKNYFKYDYNPESTYKYFLGVITRKTDIELQKYIDQQIEFYKENIESKKKAFLAEKNKITKSKIDYYNFTFINNYLSLFIISHIDEKSKLVVNISNLIELLKNDETEKEVINSAITKTEKQMELQIEPPTGGKRRRKRKSTKKKRKSTKKKRRSTKKKRKSTKNRSSRQ